MFYKRWISKKIRLVSHLLTEINDNNFITNAFTQRTIYGKTIIFVFES
jgi:hypothetical protein